ncbi:hypothetical protein [Desertibaculum subflavum]|uniref:hypothetical protein n=1 Tax=Desertibaculum subflavum TaxID=2268458 RepID=UPI000E65F6F0
MDSYYLRQRRRRRLLRFLAICAFFGLLSLPVLYLLRGEVRAVAVLAYRFAKSQVQAFRAADPVVVVERSTPSPKPQSQSQPQPQPQPQPQSTASAGSAAAQPQPPRLRTVKLGETTFRIPEGYVQRKEDLGSPQNPELVLSALLPDLRPRATGRGACAPKEARCPDFAVLKLRPGRALIESEFTKRYKAAPGSFALIPGIHGLQQIPPHRSRPANERQFLAQPAGRWTWISCRELGRPSAKQPAFGVCHLDFDTPDGLSVKVRFPRDRLSDWSAIQAKAAELAAGFRG